MRYIRTKDEILDNRLMDGVMPEKISAQIFGIEPIEYSNTIEELCDDFVSVSKYGYTKPVGNVVSWNYVKTKAKYDVEYIYGAIWTDKGLMYVAKMNEKGELELL